MYGQRKHPSIHQAVAGLAVLAIVLVGLLSKTVALIALERGFLERALWETFEVFRTIMLLADCHSVANMVAFFGKLS